MSTAALPADAPPAGHNKGPDNPSEALIARLAEKHGSLVDRAQQLLAAAPRLPAIIEDDDTNGRAGDFVKQVAAAWKAIEAERVSEKEPFRRSGEAVDAWAKKLLEPLDKLKKLILDRQGAFMRAKAAAERARREAEAQAAREAQEKADREALEALAAQAPATTEGQQVAAAATASVALDAAAGAQQTTAKAERAATAPAADMARTRGDFGAVSTLRTDWTGEVVDKATLDLEALRPFLHIDDLNKAVRAAVKSGARELRGAHIFERQTANVR